MVAGGAVTDNPALHIPMVISEQGCAMAFYALIIAKVMERKKNRGRPPKADGKLTRSINLKLTSEDYFKVLKKAASVVLTATQYAREMTLNGGVKSRFTVEELELLRKLSGIANNLNQLAKRANQSGFYFVKDEVLPILNWIKALLNDR